MKNTIIIAILTILSTSVKAQEGMKFEHNIHWKDILKKAKTEKKYIFVDCYTTWCGPCKYMDSNVFVVSEVGRLYNDKFINIKFQLDSTGKDDDDVKAQYADASFIKNTCNISSYPTFLFFNSDGELISRGESMMESAEFITKGSNALDLQKQYSTQLKNYEAGKRDEAFLKNLSLLAAQEDKASAEKFTKEYLSTQTDLFSNNNMLFISQTTFSTRDTGYTLILNNKKRFDSIVGKDKITNVLRRASFQYAFSVIKPTWGEAEWNAYGDTLREQFPSFAEDQLLTLKGMFYQHKKDWEGYAKAVEEYAASNYPLPTRLNQCAWTIFSQCNNIQILKKALQWSKQSFISQKDIDPNYMNTYANLLYKTGKKSEALKWELKAQKIAVKNGEDKDWGDDVINKIKKGEKTW